MAETSVTDDPSESRRQKAEKLLRLYHQRVSDLALISARPIILYLSIDIDIAGFTRCYKFLFDSLAERNVYILCPTYWYFEKQKHIEKLRRSVEEYKTLYPKLSLFFLSNTTNQHDLFARQGLNSIYCNHNCLVDEKLFYPIPETKKVYDAVYDARFDEWKRHSLALSIKSLGLIYHKAPFLEDSSYVEKTKKDLSFAKFFNRGESGQYKILSSSEVNRALNQSRVGLCLSAEEGAMFASIQYLLAGLPVVTTQSVGGRHVFFDDEVSITVDATPEAVSRGVKDMIDRNLSPEFIRGRTIGRISTHRDEFIKLGEEIYKRENCDRQFKVDFEKLFTNKLVKRVNHQSIVEFLLSQRK